MDDQTGKMINPNLEDYKVPGTMEIPEIVSIAYDTDRKITGIGEPPTIPTAGAIANAVYNCYRCPYTGNPDYTGQSPQRPRLAEAEGDEKMENFAYVNAADVEQVPSLLSDDWIETKMIAEERISSAN